MTQANVSPTIVLPTRFGDLSVKVAKNDTDLPPWVVIYREPWEATPFLRIHSSCLFSESFSSEDCDCALQLSESLETISKVGGAVVYLYQEGRGVGLFCKAIAMATERALGVDTAGAFKHHGFDLDSRQYQMVADALSSINFPREVRLATHNPRKVTALEQAGYIVKERPQWTFKPTPRVADYIKSKVHGLGHYERD